MIIQYDKDTFEKLRHTELSILKSVKEVCERNKIVYFLAYGTLIGAIRHGGFIPWDDDIDIHMFREDYEKFQEIFDKELGDKYRLSTPVREKGFSSAVVKVQKKGTKFISHENKKMKNSMGIFIDIFIYDKKSEDEKQYQKQVKKARRLSKLLFLAGSPYPNISMGGIKGILAKSICFCSHYILKLIPNVSKRLYIKFEENAKKITDENSTQYACYQCTMIDKSVLKKEDIFPLKQMKFEDVMVNVPNCYDEILTRDYGDYMKLPPEEERVNHAAYLVEFGDE